MIQVVAREVQVVAREVQVVGRVSLDGALIKRSTPWAGQARELAIPIVQEFLESLI